MVIGGQAVLIYGEPRLTKDIDLTLGLEPGQHAIVLRAIAELELEVLVPDPAKFLTKTFVLPARDKNSSIRIDFVFSLSQFERDAIARAKLVKLGQVDVRFASIEDLIVHKVIAGRPRDLEDVRSLLRKNSSVDRNMVLNALRSFDRELGADYEARFLSIK